MIRFFYVIAAAAIALLTSCESKPTIQKYFVEKSEAKDFMSVDIGKSIIKTDGLKLSDDQQKALASVEHVNVLFFKADSLNGKEYENEVTEVKELLKSDAYDELIKFNHDGMGGSVNTKGAGEHISEFVIYFRNEGTGFGLVRVTGNDMTPNHVFTIGQILQKSGLDDTQLAPLKQLFASNGVK
jgi:hypothetical protein